MIERNEPGKMTKCLPPGVGAVWKENTTLGYLQVKILTGEKLYDHTALWSGGCQKGAH